MARKFGPSSISLDSYSTPETLSKPRKVVQPSRAISGADSDIPSQSSVPSLEDQAVSSFFDNFVIYPCNDSSSPGFLEHLPGLFKEVRTEGRFALRWAVQAAGYASLSKDRDDGALGNKALQYYGRALSALGKSLADPNTAPDDYVLMTVVVLDLFEVNRQNNHKSSNTY